MTYRRRKKHWSTKKKAGLAGIIFMATIAIALIVVTALGLNLLDKINFSKNPGGNIGGDPNASLIPTAVAKDAPIKINDNATSLSEINVQGDTKNISNILLLGVDNNTSSGNLIARSDTNMILSINRNDGSIRMASLMRDTYVWKPGGSKRYKLNAAFLEGGFAEVQQILINQYRIQVDKVVAINFSAFQKMVDAVDGVDIALNSAEIANMTGFAKQKKPSQNADGTYHLSGSQALAFARNRTSTTSKKLSDDWGRTSRQRQTIEAILKKSKTLSAPKLLSATESILGQIHTNYSQNEIFNYLTEAPKILKYDIKGFNYPDNGEFNILKGTKYGEVLEISDPVALTLRLHHDLFD